MFLDGLVKFRMIAPNCGINFAIFPDEAHLELLADLRDKIFKIA